MGDLETMGSPAHWRVIYFPYYFAQLYLKSKITVIDANISVDAPNELAPQGISEWALEPPAQLSPLVLLEMVQVDELSPHAHKYTHYISRLSLSLSAERLFASDQAYLAEDVVNHQRGHVLDLAGETHQLEVRTQADLLLHQRVSAAEA